jgi:hypothetical protein
MVVVGRLQRHSWTAEDGSARSAVEVTAEELHHQVVGFVKQPQAADLGLRARREGFRTPNRQIRSLVLYVHTVRLRAVCAAQVRYRIQPDRQSPLW